MRRTRAPRRYGSAGVGAPASRSCPQRSWRFSWCEGVRAVERGLLRQDVFDLPAAKRHPGGHRDYDEDDGDDPEPRLDGDQEESGEGEDRRPEPDRVEEPTACREGTRPSSRAGSR